MSKYDGRTNGSRDEIRTQPNPTEGLGLVVSCNNEISKARISDHKHVNLGKTIDFCNIQGTDASKAASP